MQDISILKINKILVQNLKKKLKISLLNSITAPEL